MTERGIDLGGVDSIEHHLCAHAFFAWAHSEDLIEVDPSGKIRRALERKPDTYPLSLHELEKVRNAAVCHARPLILLMALWVRRSEALSFRWEDIDFER